MARSTLATVDSRSASAPRLRLAVHDSNVCTDLVGTIWDEDFVPSSNIPLYEAGLKRKAESVDIAAMVKLPTIPLSEVRTRSISDAFTDFTKRYRRLAG